MKKTIKNETILIDGGGSNTGSLMLEKILYFHISLLKKRIYQL